MFTIFVNVDQYSSKLSEKLAIVLEESRLEKGFSANKLAQLSGLNRQAITFIERGERNPTIESLARIAHALGEKPSHLLSRAESLSEE